MKPKKRLWKLHEEELLVQAWSSRVGELRGLRKNMPIYVKIKNELMGKKCKFSVEEVKTKIHNLTNRYKKERLNFETIGPTSDWPLYDKIDTFLREYTQPNLYTETSSEKGTNELGMFETHNISDDKNQWQEDESNDSNKSDRKSINFESDHDGNSIYNENEPNVHSDEDEASVNSSDIGETKKKKKLWSAKEVDLLIEAWGKRIFHIKGIRKNRHIFKDMQLELRYKYCDVSLDEIKTKVHNLSNRYRKECDAPSDWPLYDKVHNIFERYRNNKPPDITDIPLTIESNTAAKDVRKYHNKERCLWSEEQEKCLLNLWYSRIDELQSNRTKLHIYTDIQWELQQRNFNFTIEEIKTKIHNLTNRYRKERNMNSSNWPLFDEVHSILGNFVGNNIMEKTHSNVPNDLEIEDSSHNLHICRICLESESTLDWNERLNKTSDISYKDCYYKYTQMDEIVSDPYPQLLCESCSTDLKKVHIFIQKALETQNVLKQNLAKDVNVAVEDQNQYMEEDESQHIFDIVETTHNFESDDEYLYEALNEKESENYLLEIDRNEDRQDIAYEHLNKMNDLDIRSIERTNKNDAARQHQVVTNQRKRKIWPEDTSQICSYCSKVFSSLYAVKKHERSHQRVRKPEVTCPKCGIKLLNKCSLRTHLRLHDKNRRPKFKCDFCDKLFSTSGSRNVHRRVHLDQMEKCSICSKQFYRRVDMERHFLTHSFDANAVKPKIRYVIPCKECNREIASDKYRAHYAEHMNEPEMRCTICKKDFFGRASCNQHMKAVHKRRNGNYDDLVEYYDTERPRISHLLLKQRNEIKVKA